MSPRYAVATPSGALVHDGMRAVGHTGSLTSAGATAKVNRVSDTSHLRWLGDTSAWRGSMGVVPAVITGARRATG